MNLSQQRFFKNTFIRRYELWDEVSHIPHTRYGYETGKAIHLVDIRDSDSNRTYSVNYGFDTEPNKIHKAIEKHFNL